MTRAWRVIIALTATLAFAWVAAATVFTTHAIPVVAVVILSLLAMLASAAQSTRLAAASASVSLTSILVGAAIPLTGPVGAALVGCVSAVDPLRRRPAVVRAFNISMNGLVGALGGLLFLAVGGRVGVPSSTAPTEIIGWQLVPLAIATVAMLLVNALCVGVMISVTGGPPILMSARRIVRQVGRTYLGYGVIGFLFAVLWDPVGLGPATVLVMAAPLVLAQWSYAQQHAESVAHERTVSSLVAAVEARDPIMRGRNERVARVSELVGNQLRLSPGESDALHFAALLHDVGMVAPVESRPGAGSSREDELRRIRRHPVRGVEMLRSIEFLGDSITAIRHHHERWDGTGYPDGLAGEQIPLLAQVLAVVDAFCALAPRVGVPMAVDVLNGRAAVQFAPECVRALAEVAEAAGEAATIEAGPGDQEPAIESRWLDHDLPEASDLLASERLRR